jgi:hypothetical protein
VEYQGHPQSEFVMLANKKIIIFMNSKEWKHVLMLAWCLTIIVIVIFLCRFMLQKDVSFSRPFLQVNIMFA